MLFKTQAQQEISFNKVKCPSFVRQKFTTLSGSCDKFIDEVADGLLKYEPELAKQGDGGAYFLRNTEGEYIAVFKPSDEEPFSENSPKQTEFNLGRKQGIVEGGGALRELATYLLDRKYGGTVPFTCLVELSHPYFGQVKVGSLQKFMKNECAAWDIGSSSFPVEQIHKIGILDICVMNTDRHGGNLLIHKEGSLTNLIPIDHAYCFPAELSLMDLYFEWHHWNQSKVAFSEEVVKMVQSIDVRSDLEIMKGLTMEDDSLKIYLISTLILKRAVSLGWTLYEIANLVSDEDLDLISSIMGRTKARCLENSVLEIEELVQQEMENLTPEEVNNKSFD